MSLPTQHQRPAYFALALLFLLRSLWIPAHLATEPHDHAVGRLAAAAEPVVGVHHHHHSHDHGHTHPHPSAPVVATADEGPSDGGPGGPPEPSPHAPHPVGDHLVGLFVVPGVDGPEAPGDVEAIPGDAAVGLKPAPFRALVRAPTGTARGRPPPPLPPTRAPPAA